MDYRTLGPAGPKVSRLCLGTNNFGKQLDEARAKAVVAKALDVGINMLDTADVYNDGHSEEIIGKAVEGRRNQVMVASKVGIVTDGGPRAVNLSAKYIEKHLGDSLRRLKTDYIDLYYLHRFDPDAPLEETLGALDRFVRLGKVKYVGVSNFTAEQLDRTLKMCETRGFAKPVAMQTQYSLLARDAEKELIPYSASKGASVFVYSPLWGGFLTGKYSAGGTPPKGSRGEANKRYWERIEKEGNFAMVERLREVAGKAGISLRELALGWILGNPGVTAPIVGASTPDQVVENSKVIDVRLGPNVIADLQRIFG